MRPDWAHLFAFLRAADASSVITSQLPLWTCFKEDSHSQWKVEVTLTNIVLQLTLVMSLSILTTFSMFAPVPRRKGRPSELLYFSKRKTYETKGDKAH